MESKKLNKLVKTLREGDKIYFTYKNPINGDDMQLIFNCYCYANNEAHFAIDHKSLYGNLTSMNVSKITSNYINMYDFNMFNQKTVFKMKISEITFNSIEYKNN